MRRVTFVCFVCVRVGTRVLVVAEERPVLKLP